MNRNFVLILVLLVCHSADAMVGPPNVILFLADDMGMGDTSAYQDVTGNPDDRQVATPSMERLAASGIRFTDAHTPSSRCSPTRYGLLTGRYPWRNRLKYWVLFGSQGDPMIETDRPTLASLFRDQGYVTALFGKWHVGLRYRRSDGGPAAGFLDADLTRPLHTCPLDHGFAFSQITSRSHGTSGPAVDARNFERQNTPKQDRGPGHIHGRTVVGATGEGRKLVESGPQAYVLRELGARHSDAALEFLRGHFSREDSAERPFFLYYPANSNHTPYTPVDEIGGIPVAGAARTKSGLPMDARHDFIYENDVALGRFLDFLETQDDPRNPGQKLVENTLVIFSSDNGAEIPSKLATGPFRTHKGSVFEGGHRVPLLVSWPAGGLRRGDCAVPVGLIDCYATFADILAVPLPDLAAGEKGAEDSRSMLAIWRGEQEKRSGPLLFNDHKEAGDDPAVIAIRSDDPVVGGQVMAGQWKMFCDAALARRGEARPFALFELSADPMEENNRLDEEPLAPLVEHLRREAEAVRNGCGVRYREIVAGERMSFRWGAEGAEIPQGIRLDLRGAKGEEFHVNNRGLGLVGGDFLQVDSGEALLLSFDRDVLVESVGIVAGNGVCGGFYQMGDTAPLAIYCIDGDNDSRDQSGLLSDLGILKKGEVLRLDSGPHWGVETPGRWRLQSLSVVAVSASDSAE